MEEQRKNRYIEKLNSLQKYFTLLGDWLEKNNLDDLTKNQNYQLLFAIYHSFQLCIEVIMDLSAMISKDSDQISQDSYKNYEYLLLSKIIDNDMFNVLKEFNGLRNRIVHDYNGLIDRIAWNSMIKNKHFIIDFHDAIKKWIKDQ